MYHLAAGFFFTIILAASLSALAYMVRQYWQEIAAALTGDMPRRRTARPWTRQVRVTVRPRPVLATAPRRRVAV